MVKGAYFYLGNDFNIDLWKDPMVPSITNFTLVARIDIYTNLWRRVADLSDLERDEWNFDLVRDLFED